ncbi:MAG TPA: hypothetical protein VGD22_17315 [Sphingobacteriaceae bacterium]
MKSFSITQLEQARKNPAEFAKLLKSGGTLTQGGFGYPKSLRWLNAACKFHITHQIADAINCIEDGFMSRKDTSKNRKEVATFIEALHNYEEEITRRKLILIRSRELVNIPLSPTVRLSGQIPLIFMNPLGGFLALFVSLPNQNWEGELKFPVVQDYIAKTVFNTDSSNVSVGYVDYYSGTFYETTYSEAELTSFREEIDNIGRVITINL